MEISGLTVPSWLSRVAGLIAVHGAEREFERAGARLVKVANELCLYIPDYPGLGHNQYGRMRIMTIVDRSGRAGCTYKSQGNSILFFDAGAHLRNDKAFRDGAPLATAGVSGSEVAPLTQDLVRELSVAGS